VAVSFSFLLLPFQRCAAQLFKLSHPPASVTPSLYFLLNLFMLPFPAFKAMPVQFSGLYRLSLCCGRPVALRASRDSLEELNSV
jgi:hypothetical protein